MPTAIIITILVLIVVIVSIPSSILQYGGGKGIVDMDTLVFSEKELYPEIKNRPIWSFQLPLPLEDFKPPNKNSSKTVKKELDYLYHLSKQDNASARQLAMDIEVKGRSVLSYFEKYAGENSLMYDRDHIKRVAQDSVTLAYLVKSYYNRLRPYQIAYLYNMPLLPVKMARVSSYPCEKTLTAKLLAYQLSYNNPQHSKNLHSLAKRIELSRYYGGLNFPSDTVASIKLAELLKDRMKYLEAT